MKLMFCGSCGDVVSPGLVAMEVRWCHCHRHAVWWVNPDKGVLHVHDKMFPARNGGDGGRAWVIGLHNSLLLGEGLVCTTRPDEDNRVTKADFVEAALKATPDGYLFKKANSLVVRFAPGASSDTAWSTLPVKSLTPFEAELRKQEVRLNDLRDTLKYRVSKVQGGLANEGPWWALINDIGDFMSGTRGTGMEDEAALLARADRLLKGPWA